MVAPLQGPSAWEWTLAYLQHARGANAALAPVGHTARGNYNLGELA